MADEVRGGLERAIGAKRCELRNKLCNRLFLHEFSDEWLAHRGRQTTGNCAYICYNN